MTRTLRLEANAATLRLETNATTSGTNMARSQWLLHVKWREASNNCTLDISKRPCVLKGLKPMRSEGFEASPARQMPSHVTNVFSGLHVSVARKLKKT